MCEYRRSRDFWDVLDNLQRYYLTIAYPFGVEVGVKSFDSNGTKYNVILYLAYKDLNCEIETKEVSCENTSELVKMMNQFAQEVGKGGNIENIA